MNRSIDQPSNTTPANTRGLFSWIASRRLRRRRNRRDGLQPTLSSNTTLSAATCQSMTRAKSSVNTTASTASRNDTLARTLMQCNDAPCHAAPVSSCTSEVSTRLTTGKSNTSLYKMPMESTSTLSVQSSTCWLNTSHGSLEDSENPRKCLTAAPSASCLMETTSSSSSAAPARPKHPPQQQASFRSYFRRSRIANSWSSLPLLSWKSSSNCCMLQPAQPAPAVSHQMVEIEVAPNHYAPFYGLTETMSYLSTHHIVLQATPCMVCQDFMFGLPHADYILCPTCRVVSPIPLDRELVQFSSREENTATTSAAAADLPDKETVNKRGGGVALGLTLAHLQQCQPSLFV